MKNFRKYAIAGPLALAFSAHTMAAGTLLADGTLNSPGDLTRIQVSPTSVLEFLDLSVTNGMTVGTAVSSFSGFGFRWANGLEVSDLSSAFGISYGNQAGAITTTTSNQVGRASFVSRLSPTYLNGSLGWVDDLTTSTFHTFLCVGTNTCEGTQPPGGSFVFNTSQFWPSNPTIGVFLVRVVPVPEPATYVLFSAGVLSIAVLRRRRPTAI